jgi:UDP-N-acetylmuramate--alanine ligase
MTAPSVPLDLSSPGRFHVVGVGGPGMSAVAIVLAEMGHRVSGSDIREREVLDLVRASGVAVHIGHERELVDGCDAVTYSTAIPASNVEVDEARLRSIPALHRSGMLGSICARAQSLGVAGTHGKTTTTSMLMLVMAEAGLDPSFVVGGEVANVGTGAHWSGGDWLVVEADESDGTHLALPLYGTILTNVDVDHLDHYGTFDAIVAGFDRYLHQIEGPKVLCLDDPVCAELAASHAAITYGIENTRRVGDRQPLFEARSLRQVAGGVEFEVVRRSEALGRVRLPLRGHHNVRNALAVVSMAHAIGIPFDTVAAALARFAGVARRFDVRGVDGGATFIDDYAHLPAEIAAVLSAARTSGEWKRVVAVFQPNRFNRMAELWPAYRDAFIDADLVVLTEIYPSGTAPIAGVTGKLVVNAVLDAHPGTSMVWMPDRAALVDFLAHRVGDGDVCISMGCGDVADLPSEVLARRAEVRH